MAISWSSYHNGLRVGQEVLFSPSSPTHDDTTVTITFRVYVGTSSSQTFRDNQTLHVSGSSSATVDYYNDLNQSQQKLVYTKVFTGQAISYSSGSRTWTTSISGAFNGASPSLTKTWNLPNRPPGVPLAPGTPNVSDVQPTSATLSWSTPSNEGSALTQARLQISTNSSFSNIVKDETFSWTTSRNVTGLPKGTTLYARVYARNGVGWSQPSGTRTFTTGTTLPNAPEGLAASSITGTSATITWNAPTDDGGTAITGYRVQRALNSSFSSGVVTTDLPASPRSLQITGLSHTTTYWVRVLAKNSVGNSSYSSSISFTTTSTVPSAPPTPSVSNITPVSASVSFSAPSDSGGSSITGYDVQYATDSGFTTGVVVVSASSSPKVLTNLTPDRTYWVRVRAKNANGAGPYSGSTSFRTTSGLLIGDGSAWQQAAVWNGDGTTWRSCRVRTGDGTVWR